MRTAESIIEVKSEREIAKMREASRIAADILKQLAAFVKPDLNTQELDEKAASLIAKVPGATAAFLGYRGFPANLCVSINSEVVHGIPGPKKIVKEGDLVSLDFGIKYKGYYGDCALTVGAGKISDSASRLMDVTRESLDRAIKVVRDGATVGDIGHAVQSFVEEQKMSVVREFVGHGIGRHLHEDPAIPNWGSQGRGAKLVAGMTIAIEPMVSAGAAQVFVAKDGWTAKTKDGSLSAHFEHTLLVTQKGCEVLTA